MDVSIKQSKTKTILIALTAIILCFLTTPASANAKSVTAIYKGENATVTAKVKIEKIDAKGLALDAGDYIKYLDEAEIGNGLVIPMNTATDYDKMKRVASSEAMSINDRLVKHKKANDLNKQAKKEAKKAAKKKAKTEYKESWDLKSTKMGLPTGTNGWAKTYMYMSAVNNTGSPQYALLHSKKAYTKDSFRMYDGYYCVAMGSYYGRVIGTKYYVKLSNGKTIRVILADQKQDRHTDANHQYAVNSGDILEFVVEDTKYLGGGNVSDLPEFAGSIIEIRKIDGSDEITEY